MKSVGIRVHGTVQGVYFRHNAKQMADRLGLNGFVRNESDGSVYIEVEGGDGDVQSFIDWAQRGPEKADVNRVDVQPVRLQNFSAFVIQK